MQEQLKNFDIKPDKLAIQTLFWCMREKLRQDSASNRQTTYWMAGFTLDEIDRRDDFYNESKWMGVGTDAINNPLSEKRASSVSTYVKSCGVNAAQIRTVEGQGSTNPVADNSTVEGRKQNRRVEVYMYASEAMIKAAQEGSEK